MLENISIVLVEPKGDENVGMAARAMKNCGLTDLRLVKPVPFKTRGAKKWACSARDVLDRAKVFKTLGDAISDATLVVGLSRREGSHRPPTLLSSKAPSTIYARTKKGRVALVFGREADGLNGSELDLCDFVWTISTSKLYPSLNLAQAVMVAGHEIFKCLSLRAQRSNPRGKHEIATAPAGPRNDTRDSFVSKKEIAPVLKKFSHALVRLGYDDSDGGKLRRKIVREFEKLFSRGGLYRKDVNMFLGLTARIQEYCSRQARTINKVANGKEIS